MKRLLVRLSLLSALVAAGVFAIVQSQQERGQSAGPAQEEGQAPLPPQVPLQPSETVVAGAENDATEASPPDAIASLIPLPAQYGEAGRGDDYVLPAPTPAIVRGNNDDSEDDDPETEQLSAGNDVTPDEDRPGRVVAGVGVNSDAGVTGQIVVDERDSGASPSSGDAPEQPPANHLAQNDGAGARSRNPFGPRSGYEAAADSGARTAAYESDGAENATQAGHAAPAEGGSFPLNAASGAPSQSPAAAESQDGGYQPYSPEPDAPGGGATSSNANQQTVTSAAEGAPAPAEPTPAAPLGAPRELTPYAGASGRAADAGYPAPKPINGQTSDAQGQPAPAFSFDRSAQPGATATEPAPTAAAPYGGASPQFDGGVDRRNGGIEGVGTPGPQALEGAQTPSVTLKKIAPPEIQVGKPATFEIQVRNVGRVAAHQVIVKEEIPRGVQFVDAAPPAASQGAALLWELGTLEAGDSRQIKVQYLPVAEGDIGSVAVAAFQAQASVRTVCTRPQLTIEQSAPEKVLLGQSFTVRIRLANPGTGVANKVVLEEDVPDGFTHAAGRALEYEVGALRPGESRDLDLTLQAAKPGVWDNTLVVRGEGNLAVEHSAKVEIVAPQLELAMTGPTRRYLDRQATYTVAIANPGTATANDVQLVGRLPKGMKFVAANNEGQYDPKTHVVVWSLAELPPGQVGQIQLTALPVETGEQKIVVEGKGDLDVTAQTEHAVAVEALAELAFEIADQADPIEVNKETIYEVTVSNKGSKTATNVRVAAVFPPDMKPLAGDGPARAEVSGNRLLFEPLARLNPREQATFRIQAQGLRAGDQRIQVQVVSDDSPTPVTKEESTRIYADR